jgi:hypothetical protein
VYKDNIKVDVREEGCDDMNRFELALGFGMAKMNLWAY